jgi:hypothetical protein
MDQPKPDRAVNATIEAPPKRTQRRIKYKTKDGRPISLRWDENVEGENRGWVVHKMTAIVDGQEAGYLKAAYIPQCEFDNRYKNILAYLEHTGHRGINDEPRKSLEKISSVALSWKNWLSKDKVEALSDEEVQTLHDEYVQILEKRYGTSYEIWRRIYVDRPIVAFVRTFDGFLRQRVALALYEATARKLADQGLVLYCDSENNPHAEGQHLWRYMARHRRLRKHVKTTINPRDPKKLRIFLQFGINPHEKEDAKHIAKEQKRRIKRKTKDQIESHPILPRAFNI